MKFSSKFFRFYDVYLMAEIKVGYTSMSNTLEESKGDGALHQ